MTKAQAYRLGFFIAVSAGYGRQSGRAPYLADLKAEYEAIRLR